MLINQKTKQGYTKNSIRKLSWVDLAILANTVGTKNLNDLKIELQNKVIQSMEKQGHLPV